MCLKEMGAMLLAATTSVRLGSLGSRRGTNLTAVKGPAYDGTMAARCRS